MKIAGLIIALSVAGCTPIRFEVGERRDEQKRLDQMESQVVTAFGQVNEAVKRMDQRLRALEATQQAAPTK